MSSFAHKSFLYGVILASVTWALSLYLYFTLTSASYSSYRNMTLSSSSTFSSDNDEDAYIPLRNSFKLPNYGFIPPEKEKDTDNQNQNAMIAQPRYESKWREKFRKLVELSEKSPPGGYANSDRLSMKTLKKNTIISGLSGKDSIGLVKNLEEKKLREEGYKKHAFNALISERIGYHRVLPDTRHSLCSPKMKTYPPASELPKASIVICFYNEEFHALLRTVHSVLDRTNPVLLKEILLVDDTSDLDDLHNRVVSYHFPKKVKVLKTARREGLIRARIFGARHATGEVLVFLDSHVETNVGWLEPLLARIHDDRNIVVTPIIDIINADTFEYSKSPLVKGGFNWGLHFRWDPVKKEDLKSEEDYVKPIVSPTMAGGLFAMDRKYFKMLGEYDEGMDVWGGENTEISFRIWMCGGRLEIIPCSRVGHVFRKRRPYGSDNPNVDTTKRNSIRVAEVWMDEYKKKFYDTHPDARGMPHGELKSRLKLRQNLNCKSFHWYLQNVYPEMLREGKATIQNIDSKKKNRKFLEESFMLRLSRTQLCVESLKEVTQKNSALVLGKCQKVKRQRWSETEKHEFVLAELLCLDASGEVPKLKKCHDSGGTQEWKRAGVKETPIFNIASGMCLGLEVDGRKPTVGDKLRMVICDETSGRTFLKFDLRNEEEEER